MATAHGVCLLLKKLSISGSEFTATEKNRSLFGLVNQQAAKPLKKNDARFIVVTLTETFLLIWM